VGDVTIPAGALALFTAILTALTGTITFLYKKAEGSHEKAVTALKDGYEKQLSTLVAVTDERIKVIREVHIEALRIAEERRVDEVKEKEFLRGMLGRAIDNLGLATDVAGTAAREAIGLGEGYADTATRRPQ
jgi:hypothetical protein